MGALQRLTYLLARLDPNNQLWKQQQLDRAEADRQTARGFMDEKLRQQAADAADRRIEEIKNAFNTNNHELDYARKLYLIENCLYGVDIQPVAVQITKLRCFIALLVEQKADAVQARQPEHNLGIRPLPNLETKFVAANTLLRLEEEAPAAGRQMGLLAMDNEVGELRRELREVRHQYFTVRGRTAKLRLRAQDADLRLRLGQALQRSGMPAADARHLAEWNPYDLKLAADFFSPKWMLGVDDGFDVVIGNPPYVRQEKFTAFKSTLQKLYPSSYDGKADLYVYFYDRAIQLLKLGGGLCYITNNKYFLAGYGLKVRNFLRETTSVLQIINFGDAPVFDAIAYPTIVLTQKGQPSKEHVLKTLMWEIGPAIETFPVVFADKANLLPQTALRGDGWQFGATNTRDLLNKLRTQGKTLEEYAAGKIFRGVVTGMNEAFVVDAETRRLLIKADKRSNELLKPYLRGRDVKRWNINDPDLWLIFTRRGTDIDKYPAIKQHLAQFRSRLTPGAAGGRKPGAYQWFDIQDNVAFWQEFDKPKILWPGISLERAPFGFDTVGKYVNDNVHFISSDDLYLLGVLNSRVTGFVNELTCDQVMNGYLRMKIAYVKTYPIPNATAIQKKPVETLVNQILAAKAASATADTTALERQVDALVYKLYDLTDEEITLVEGRSA